MIHEHFSDTIESAKRLKPNDPQRSLIGRREILLVIIAFAFLAVAPVVT